MAAVILESLSKAYGEILAVDDVDLAIADGETLALVGPSGCGKTTTLRMIAGLERPTSGTIRIGDRVVNQLRPRDRNVSMVFQDYALYPHLNVYQNLAFGLKMRGWSRADIEQRVRRVAGQLTITELLTRRIDELSGGQQQRIALGRALVRAGDVFLLDEPLSNLDTQLRVAMRAELGQLRAEFPTTSIYVTHDQMDALMLGDRIAVMHQGRLQQIGTPTEVYQRPANRFVARFIGYPPMNIFPGTLRTENGSGVVQCQGFAMPIANRGGRARIAAGRVLLGVRPEDVHYRSDTTCKNWPHLTARVSAVRVLGGEAVADLTNDDIQLQIRVEQGAQLAADQQITAYLDPAKCHLFDAETGQRLWEG